MSFVAVLVICFDLDTCQLRVGPGDERSWSSIEACLEYAERLKIGARDEFGQDLGHASGWCIPVSAENRLSQADSQADQPS